MTVTTTSIGNTNMHNGAMIKPVTPNPEVLERSSGRRQVRSTRLRVWGDESVPEDLGSIDGQKCDVA